MPCSNPSRVFLRHEHLALPATWESYESRVTQKSPKSMLWMQPVMDGTRWCHSVWCNSGLWELSLVGNHQTCNIHESIDSAMSRPLPVTNGTAMNPRSYHYPYQHGRSLGPGVHMTLVQQHMVFEISRILKWRCVSTIKRIGLKNRPYTVHSMYVQSIGSWNGHWHWLSSWSNKENNAPRNLASLRCSRC